MKKVENASAPVANDATANEPTVNQDAASQNGNESQNGSESQIETPAPKQEPTLDELKTAAKAAATKAAEMAATGTDEEAEAAMTAAFRARKLVTDFENKRKAEERRLAIEQEMEQKKSLFYDAIKAYDEMQRANLALATIPADQRETDAGKAAIQTANDAKTAYDAAAKLVTDILAGKRPNVTLHVAGNVTGEKLENATRKTGVGQEIVDHFVAGKTAKEIIEMGYSRGTTHAVILAYKREKGLA